MNDTISVSLKHRADVTLRLVTVSASGIDAKARIMSEIFFFHLLNLFSYRHNYAFLLPTLLIFDIKERFPFFFFEKVKEKTQ